MKKNNQSEETDIAIAEEIPLEEQPLEKAIENTLVKHNITNKVIAELKEKFGSVRLKDVNDKESFLEVKDARKTVRSVGIVVERLCKKGREDAIAIQRKWLTKEKEILEKIAEIQDPLDAEIKKFDDEVARKDEEERRRLETRWINRNSELLKVGAKYNNANDSWELNHISYEHTLIKEASDDTWNDTILPKYKKVYEEIEAAKVEEENKRKEELAKQKKEREEFEMKQAEFKKQQEAFAQKEAELQKQKDDADRKERLLQEQKEAEEKRKKQSVIDERIKQLHGINIQYNQYSKDYTFIDDDINISEELISSNIKIPDDLYSLTNEEFDSIISSIKPMIDNKKKEVEEKKFALIEKQKQEAIAKALEDEKIKRQQEEQKKAEELAVASDKSKWLHFTSQLSAIQIPEFKSNVYKKRLQIAKEKIEEIQEL